jgi:hypothetical protein
MYFGLKKGFYGLKAGKSIHDLSNTESILKLDPEIQLAEILTRNLQALSSGATQPELYAVLVR